jgi:NTP pyrophosphatase (non-canonical NTP hydrolase)
LEKAQDIYQKFQEDMGWEHLKKEDYRSSREHLLFVHMLLTTEVAEVAEEFRKMFKITEENIKNGRSESEAYQLAKDEVRQDLGKELADCLAYLCKLANFFDYNLEEELYAKLTEVRERYKTTVNK